MIHHCPSCGRRNHYGPGAVHFALECRGCGQVARQHPHAPIPTAAPPATSPTTDGTAVTDSTVAVVGTAHAVVVPVKKAAAKKRAAKKAAAGE